MRLSKTSTFMIDTLGLTTAGAAKQASSLHPRGQCERLFAVSSKMLAAMWTMLDFSISGRAYENSVREGATPSEVVNLSPSHRVYAAPTTVNESGDG